MSADYVSPKPSGFSKPTVERIAEAIADKIGFRPGDSIESVVSMFGGKIVAGTNGDDDSQSGSIVARSMSDFTIYISQFTSLVRDRFTIAHELGHLVLHLSEIHKDNPFAVMRATRWVDENNPEQKRAEWEANWFAAAFLMPAKIFSEIYNKDEPSEAQRIFGVSAKAIEIRAKSLDL